MLSRPVLAAAAAAAVALLAAGCGGGAGAGAAAAGVSGGAATVVPADTAAFVSVDTDVGSAQWQALGGLLSKLPASSTILSRFRQLQPALGPELDLAVLPAVSGGKPEAVLLTQPADPAKLTALLGTVGGGKLVTGTAGGWTAVSESRSALDAVTGASSHLADSSLYQEATGRLAAGAVAEAYANGAQARALLASLGRGAPTNGQLVWAAAGLTAAGDGLKVEGYVRGGGGEARQAYDAALVRKIPSGQLLVADFQAGSDSAAAFGTSPLGQALGKLGDSLGGESAFYVSPGSPLPALTLVTQASDPQAVLGAIHHALASAGSGVGSFLGGLTLSHATVGSDLVVSTSQAQIAAFEAGGQKLAADAGFRQARTASGMPAQTSGFVYVDVKDALSALGGLGSLAGVPTGLGSLQSLIAYGGGTNSGVSSFTAFLGVG